MIIWVNTRDVWVNIRCKPFLDAVTSKKPLVSLTDESDTLARLGFVAVGTPVLSLGSVGSVTGAGSPRSLRVACL